MPSQTLGAFLLVLQELRLYSKEDYHLVRNLLSYLFLFSISHTSDEDFVRRILYGRHETLSDTDYTMLKPLRKKRDAILWKFLGHIRSQDSGDLMHKQAYPKRLLCERTRDVSSIPEKVKRNKDETKLGKSSLKTNGDDNSERSWRKPAPSSDHEKPILDIPPKSDENPSLSTPDNTTEMSVEVNTSLVENTSLYCSTVGRERNHGELGKSALTDVPATESSLRTPGKRTRDVESSSESSNNSKQSKPKPKLKRTANNSPDRKLESPTINVNSEKSECTCFDKWTDKWKTIEKEIQTLRNGMSLSIGEMESYRIRFNQLESRLPNSRDSISNRPVDDDQDWQPDVVKESAPVLRGNQAKKASKKTAVKK